MDLTERTELFRKDVITVGGSTYTAKLIDHFIDYWTEPNRAKNQKMRWELQKTWDTKRRLVTWAGRTRNYAVFLSQSQKTIQEKKKAFAISLEPFLEKYGKEMLNSFYRYYAQPENVENPERLRWECEPFWELPTRLQTWHSKPNNQPQQNQYARR